MRGAEMAEARAVMPCARNAPSAPRYPESMMQRLFGLFLLLGFATIGRAHFVFIVPQAGGETANVILNEELKPSAEVDAGMIGGAKLSLRGSDGHETALALKKGDHVYVTALPGSGTRLIHGVVDLGLMQRGQEKPYVLTYYPKAIAGDAFDPKELVGSEAPVELVPVGKAGALRLKLLVKGKPQPNTEITILLPDGTQKKATTDESGQTETLSQTGRYGAWARYWETASGEREGKSYAEVRNYATLVFDAPATAASRFATLPQAASSFGAVASDGWLYVYGGHIAPTHSYSTEAVSGQFSRLKLSGGAAWERLPDGPALQGMNLAAYRGKIYRVGGMAPRNKPGAEADTRSIADCARFDPATRSWEALPPLPELRSSHDVVVIGSKLIVVGGWTLKGAAPTEWLDTLEALDLAAPKLEWKSAKQPFKRRALIAAAYRGKMYVIGGFDENAKVVREVAIYDPASGAWTKGPELPGGEQNAFAPAACVHEDSLYVSLADGVLYRLDESGERWEKSGAATPRIAHRLASYGKTILVIGGASKGTNSDLVEAVAVR